MQRDAFEKLVSAWLDEPQRDDLRRQVEDAVRAAPELAADWEAWQRLAGALGGCPAALDNIDWGRVQARISQTIARAGDTADTAVAPGDTADKAVAPGDTVGAALMPSNEDQALDEALLGLPSIERQVDWPRFRHRIASTVRATGAQRLRRRWRLVGGSVAAVGLAAAAALVISLLPNPGGSTVSKGVVLVTIQTPAAASLGGGVAVARVSISNVPVAHEQPQQFFSVDPIQRPASSDDAAGYY
jgi:hypothetical protein